ncbi:MAG: IS630 family transposase [Pirellula sp.]
MHGDWQQSKKNEVKPWRVKSWCIGKPDAKYVAKMEDVLDVYQRPYDPARPVVCIDEKSKELHTEIRPTIPAQSGRPGYRDYEYKRNGTANLFLWVEPLAGRREVRMTDRRCAVDFAELLDDLADRVYPQANKIVLVVDNLNTHGPHCLYQRYPPEEAHRLASRFEWHYTPEHGSWLNIAECELSVLARQCTNKRIADQQALATATLAWQTQRNSATATIRWQFTTADARIKLRRLYPVI